MRKSEHDNDNDDPKWVWPHPADLGTILIAFVFLVAMVGTIIWLFSSPEPVRDLFGKKPPAAESNEVTIMLPQKK